MAMAVPAAASQDTFREGDTVGKYLIIRLLGQGATANVYLATHSGEGRFVALKAMRPELTGQSAVREMFLFEARLLTQFEHPNVVRALEVGEMSKDPYLVLEYLDGAPMHLLIAAAAERNVRIPFPVVATLMDGALAGLEHVHTTTKTRKGIVHCDISPYNLFATYEGDAKLIDFGIARVGTKAARTNDVRGRYAYMAPEQALARPFDHRADLFSMGVVLWEVMAGQRLFRRGDDETTKQAMLTMRVPRLMDLIDDDAPPGLDDVVRAALQRDPEQRVASAAELRAMLRQVAEGVGGLADPIDVAQFCSSLTGGSLLSPGVSSLAPMRPKAYSIELAGNLATAPAMPILKPEELGFGAFVQGMAPNFGADDADADLPPAFRALTPAAPMRPLGDPNASGALPMFEDEFTVMADGVMALRGSGPKTPAHAMHTSGMVHTPMVAAPPKRSRLGVTLVVFGLLFAVGAGGAFLYLQNNPESAFEGEPAMPPAASPNPEAVETIELDSLPGERNDPLGGGVGSGNALSPAGTPPPDPNVIEMKDGYLDVLAGDPPAVVYIDGKPIGKTPMRAYALPAGQHVVQLIRNGKSLYANMVQISEDEIASVDVSDKPIELE